MSREAKIKLIAEGAARARSEVNSVSDSVRGLGSVGSAAAKVLSDLGKSAFHAASDAAKAMNDVKPIDFGSAADKAKIFEDTVTRLSMRTGESSVQMQKKFRSLGEDLGVSAARVANFTKSLTDSTGAKNAGDSLEALGRYANDTGRSLEDLAETGRSLYSDFGISLDQIGGALNKVRAVALDFAHVGGPVELEKSLVRLAPLLARFEGGSLERRAALVGVFGKGKSARVAEETTSTILGAFSGANTMLVEQTMRGIRRDPTYTAYTTDATGQTVLKPGVLAELQKHFRSRPSRAVQGFFGSSVQGLQAAQTFMGADLGSIDRMEARLEETRKALVGQGAIPLGEELAPSQREALGQIDIFGKRKPAGFAETAAGKRARTDVERENVELGVGEVIQAQRDKRNAQYAGNRGTQAALDTARSYLPSTYERVLDIGEAVGVEAKTAHEANRPQTVELGSASVARMAEALRSAPLAGRPEPPPASVATEANKARGRSLGAN